MGDWSAQELEALPTRFRGNLINGIAGFKPALLVGTADAQGQTNLALFSSVFHIGANPTSTGAHCQTLSRRYRTPYAR